MKERITRLYSWINAQDSFEVKDIGMQLLSLIEEQERRITSLEGAKNTEQANQPDAVAQVKQMLYRHYAGNNKSFPDFVLKGEKMRCENCNGIGIVNLYEKTGENISTDCHLCNGTGQISHRSSREKAAKGMKPLAK